MIITAAQLHAIYPAAKKRVDVFLDAINNTLKQYHITTPARVAAFLAQIGHESGQLLYVREIASGQAYEGRADLGNSTLGDGIKYKGRGLIQITGRANYAQVEKELGIPCIKNPEILEEPLFAALVSGWYWDSRRLNELADKRDFIKITKKINGGVNGLADRQEIYERALVVLKA